MEGSGTQYFIIVLTQIIARSLFKDGVEEREDVSPRLCIWHSTALKDAEFLEDGRIAVCVVV